MIIKIINIPSTILLEIIHDNNEIDKDALPLPVHVSVDYYNSYSKT